MSLFKFLRGKGFKTKLTHPADTFWDLKLGISTWGHSDAPVDDGMPYSPASYKSLETSLNKLGINSEDVFFDLGCGLGRPLFFVDYHYKPKKCIGVEANSALVDMALKNTSHYRNKSHNIEIIHSLAQNVDFRDATIVYLYNPFQRKTVVAVLEQIKQSLIENPRTVKIAYLNPIDDQVLRNCEWLKNTGSIKHSDIKSLNVGENQEIAVTTYESII